jgi:hypothetical protein
MLQKINAKEQGKFEENSYALKPPISLSPHDAFRASMFNTCKIRHLTIPSPPA